MSIRRSKPSSRPWTPWWSPPPGGRLLREIGDHKFQEFADMPLFWLYAEAGVHPQYVAEYIFPGSITGFFTHLEYVKLAP